MTGQARDTDPLPTLRALFAEADDPVVVTDARAPAGDDGPPIVLANAAIARLTGRTPGDLTGRGCLTLLDAITEPTIVERVTAALTSDMHLRADVWTRRANGLPCPSRWEVLPLRDGRGVTTHRVIIAHDLSALRQAEQGLSDLKAITRRAGHDLNNVMTGLIVNLSLLNGSGFSESQRQGCLSDALDGARDGARTTRELLDAMRYNGGPVDFPDGFSNDTPTRIGWPRPRSNSRSDASASSSTHGADSSFTSDDGPRGWLLVLDDDEKLLKLMAGFLEHAGYVVSATSEPQECIALYRDAIEEGHCFDLVILDLTIDDGRKGLTTLEALRAIDPDVRAIAHSGQAYAEVMTAPRAHGFLAAIAKPTPLAELAATIDALLRAAP